MVKDTSIKRDCQFWQSLRSTIQDRFSQNKLQQHKTNLDIKNSNSFTNEIINYKMKRFHEKLSRLYFRNVFKWSFYCRNGNPNNHNTLVISSCFTSIINSREAILGDYKGNCLWYLTFFFAWGASNVCYSTIWSTKENDRNDNFKRNTHS